MDEPTSSLSKHETDTLMAKVQELRDDGMCVVFISHRLAEVQGIADRVIVLRDGKNSGNLERDEISRDRIVSLMVGRDLEISHKAAAGARGEAVLAVEGLRTRRFPSTPVTFHVSEGEIVVIAGLIGAGRSELLRAVFGIDRRAGGTVTVRGNSVPDGDVRGAIASGLALVPEDRKSEGVIVEQEMRDNVVLPSIPEFLAGGAFVRDGRIDAAATAARDALDIKVSSIHQILATLSGGNQQKVAIGKWARREPAVFLLDEPTRGIDIRSRGEIYHAMEAMAGRGTGVLVASSDLEEVLRIADRVLVMHEGKIAGEIDRPSMSEERIMELATGGGATG
jgi:ribose transport system ATP-binding protein